MPIETRYGTSGSKFSIIQASETDSPTRQSKARPSGLSTGTHEASSNGTLVTTLAARGTLGVGGR
jgi:hypothetical protein